MSHQKYSAPAIQARVNSPPPALITNSRISVPLQGRLYPFITPQDELPDVFREMPDRLYRQNFFREKPLPKSELFKWYADSINLLAGARREFDALAQQVAAAGGFQNPHKMLEFRNAPAATAELAARPVDQIAVVMEAVLREACRRFVSELVFTLDEMVRSQQVGIIDWTCADACRYHYFEFKDETTTTATRSQRSETVTGRVHTVTTNTERDKERIVSLTRHVHDLIDATRTPVPTNKADLTDWRNMKRDKIPPRPRQVANALPAWLPAEYVEGQQIRDLRIEREMSREKWTESETSVHTWEEAPPVIRETPRYHRDPAITVGHYVLVGWNEDEPKDKLTCPGCNGRGNHHYGNGSYNVHRTCQVCKGWGKI